MPSLIYRHYTATASLHISSNKSIIAGLVSSLLLNVSSVTTFSIPTSYPLNHKDISPTSTTTSYQRTTFSSTSSFPRTIAKLSKSDSTNNMKSKKTATATGKRTKKATGKKKKAEDDANQIPHVADSILPEWMNLERTNVLTAPFNVTLPKEGSPEKDSKKKTKTITYWMQRDMRTVDNWALLYAQHLAQLHNVPLSVVYVLPPSPTAAPSSSSLPPKVHDMPMTERHGKFLLEGLKLVEEELNEKDIPLHILKPDSHLEVGQCVTNFISSSSIDGETGSGFDSLAVVCDFNPLRHVREWMEDQAAPLFAEEKIPLIQVDAHNVVPVWHASPKREVGARTLRPKINKLLPDFMTHFPKLQPNSINDEQLDVPLLKSNNDWEECESHLNLDSSVPSINKIFKPGTKSAMERFSTFTSDSSEGLKNFDTHRNDPNYKSVCSNMSPWVNYGHISFQRLALKVRAMKKFPNGTASYIEEGIVRRELSDNYVYYSRDNYDELSAAAEWAQESLELHSVDEREYVYSLQEFEESKTHDDLWNAAQMQLVEEGKMHGFLRMYWAKKILEWTTSPEAALRTGQYLNDRYALDGNDPNGFVGIGWSIMGIHDMGWKERPIFGKIRFMNYAGCKRKFKVDTFVSRYNGARANSIRAAKRSATNVISSVKKRNRKT